MTKSLLFESIQQSPIDPLFDNLSDEGEGCSDHALLPLVAADEIPKSPPKETPLVSKVKKPGDIRPRLIDSRAWGKQIGAGVDGPNVVISQQERGGLLIRRRSYEMSLILSANGLHIYASEHQFTFGQTLPRDVATLLADAYTALCSWRSRIVRLSMESDELECSLMDDIYPPRTFLVEYRTRTALKSLRIQDGLTHWETAAGRVVTVPADTLDQEMNRTKLMHSVAPELSLLDAGQAWQDFVQLRAVCLEEDRRLLKDHTSSRDLFLHHGG